MAMDYMALLRNGYQPSGSYNMQPYSSPPHGHQGYGYPYTNDQLFMIAQLEQQRAMLSHGGMPPSKQTEPKPRLSKDEVELLEQEFQKNPKPSSGRKREIAELLKVEHPRINNWFQNRRAKEKQIKKTQEFEAQQAADRATSESNSPDNQDDGAASECLHSSNQSRPLQVSSAAFSGSDDSDQHMPLYLSEHGDSLATDGLVVGHGSSPSDEESDCLAHDEYPSPKSLPLHPQDPSDLGFTSLAHGYLPSHVSNDFEHQVACADGNLDELPQHHQLPDFEPPQPVQSLDAFGQFAGPLEVEQLVAPVPSFPSQLLATEPTAEDIKSEEAYDHEHEAADGLPVPHTSPDSTSRTPPGSGYSRFKSPPPPANIASRRNKGLPAQLNPTALRSYSYGPQTGIDMPKRSEGGSPMRRIASATGSMPGRIQKTGFGSAPRSPLYLERTKEALMRSLQGARSPVLGSLNSALSPVTPSDCPVQAHRCARETTVSSSASDDEQRYTLGTSQHAFFNPSMKTPPSTPGLGRNFPEQMLTIEAAWNYVPQDEPLVTPGLGSFDSGEFSMASSAPGYVVNSQPATPGFAPSIGPTYFPWGLSGNGPSHTEYTFPGESYMAAEASAKSSPGQPKSRQFQFTQNITPQDFSAEK